MTSLQIKTLVNQKESFNVFHNENETIQSLKLKIASSCSLNVENIRLYTELCDNVLVSSLNSKGFYVGYEFFPETQGIGDIIEGGIVDAVVSQDNTTGQDLSISQDIVNSQTLVNNQDLMNNQNILNSQDLVNNHNILNNQNLMNNQESVRNLDNQIIDSNINNENSENICSNIINDELEISNQQTDQAADENPLSHATIVNNEEISHNNEIGQVDEGDLDDSSQASHNIVSSSVEEDMSASMLTVTEAEPISTSNLIAERPQNVRSSSTAKNSFSLASSLEQNLQTNTSTNILARTTTVDNNLVERTTINVPDDRSTVEDLSNGSLTSRRTSLSLPIITQHPQPSALLRTTSITSSSVEPNDGLPSYDSVTSSRMSTTSRISSPRMSISSRASVSPRISNRTVVRTLDPLQNQISQENELPPSFDEIHTTQRVGSSVEEPPAYAVESTTITLIAWTPRGAVVLLLGEFGKVKDISRLIQEETNIPKENQIIKDFSGNTLTPESYIQHIPDIADFPHLIIKQTHMETALALDINNAQTLKIRVVNRGSKIHIVQCDLSDSVSELKQIMKLQAGINPSWQKLVFKGTILQNDRSLASYGIRKMNEIFLFLLRKSAIAIEIIFFNNNSKTFLEVSPEVSIEEIKNMAKENLTINCFSENLTLWFDAKEINCSGTLESCGITQDSRLVLIQVV